MGTEQSSLLPKAPDIDEATALEDAAHESKARRVRDPELDAIRRMVDILEALPSDMARTRVLSYVASRNSYVLAVS